MSAQTGQTPEPPLFGQELLPEEVAPQRPSGRGRRVVLVAGIVLALVCAALAWQGFGTARMYADLRGAAAVFDGARQARAREVAPESWQKAVDAMDAAVAELHRQEERPLPLRSYARVHGLLGGATAAASEAKAAAEAAAARAGAKGGPAPAADAETASAPGGPAEAYDRARDAVEAAKAALERATASLARVSNCSRAMHEIGIRRYVQNAGPALDALSSQVAALDARLAKGDTFGATVAAESLKGKIDPIVKDLDGMATKVRCKKPQ